MFRATEDLLLPTTVTGSWPRPRWYDEQLLGRPLSTRMKEVGFREQYTDALSALLEEQEMAGLDIVTHGDYHLDDTLSGHSWIRYALERLGGLEGDYLKEAPDMTDQPGRVLNEFFTAARWPRAVGRVARSEATPLEYPKIWRLAQARTRKPVMFGSVSAQVLSHFVDVTASPYEDSPAEGPYIRELMWDLACAINEELRELATAGCQVIQIEEPLLHMVCLFQPDNKDLIDFVVDCFNREVEGLDDVEVWMHTCWGNPLAQLGFEGASYANAVEIYLERMNADVWTVEAASAGGTEILELLKPYAQTMNKKIGLGVINHRTLQVESPEQVADITRKALQTIPLEKLILTTDCGFGTQKRMIATYKAASIAMGANLVRRELGLEERYVPLADSALQADYVHKTARGTSRIE